MRSAASRFLGLGDVGEIRARVDATNQLVQRMNHNVDELVRRFDEMRSDLEAISAVSLGLERTSTQIALLATASAPPSPSPSESRQ